jgi:hypothetical protein
VVSYFPVSIVDGIQAALVHDDLELPETTKEQMETQSPLIADIVNLCDNGHIDWELVGLLEQLCHRAVTCISGPNVPQDFENPGQSSADTGEYLRSGVCSGIPKLRRRPKYEADRQDTGIDGYCQHAFVAGATRTGGIFTWFCSHGVCYYFGIIKTAEGRNEPFSFLTSYLRKAPSVVVYDFACALQDYCLNRCPAFFQDTTFLVDKFHWSGHKNCSPSYNIALYGCLRHVNSVTAEQNNAALKRIRGSVSRMKQRPFMLLVHLFMCDWNRKKLKRLRRVRYHLEHL